MLIFDIDADIFAVVVISVSTMHESVAMSTKSDFLDLHSLGSVTILLSMDDSTCLVSVMYFRPRVPIVPL